MKQKMNMWRTTGLVVAISVCSAAAQESTPIQKKPAVLPAKILSSLDSLSMEYFQRRQALLDSIFKGLDTMAYTSTHLNFDFGIDSRSLDLLIPDSVLLQDEIRRRDFVGERLRDEQVDLGAVLDFGQAIRAVNEYAKKDKKKRRPDIRELPLPTPLEVDVLNMLWANGATTGPELFAKLDSSRLVALTADMFWDAMHQMAKRGFVGEKIVSPQLTMNLAVGPLVVPVEMSAKNLRNRVYEYEPLVGSDEMFRYLVAKNYLARADGRQGTNGKANRTNALLMQMVVNHRRAESRDIE